MTEFNPDKHYLGTLCKRGHGYENTGKSLKRITQGDCLECKRLYNITWRSENKKKCRIYSSRHYKKNREKCMSGCRKWEELNHEKRAVYLKKYRKKRIENLTDGYIKDSLSRQLKLKHNEIHTGLIEQKRVAFKFKRELKKTREVAHELFGT